jgi:hypothetical protein
MKFELDTRFEISLPAGTISESGQTQIKNYAFAQIPRMQESWTTLNPGNTFTDLPSFPNDWHWVWELKTKTQYEGLKSTYIGKFPKRVEKFYKDAANLTCPASFVTQIGNLARDHSSEQITFRFDFVNSIDWDDGDFGDADSCWWGSYGEARDTLTENGGLAVRFYDDDDNGIGRAWLAPYGGMYVLFNGYDRGDGATLRWAKVVSEFMGMSYEKVGLTNWNDLMYINNDSGYLIGPAETIKNVSHISLQFGSAGVTCYNCGTDLEDESDEYTGSDDETYCESCYDARFTRCEHCEETVRLDDTTYIEAAGGSVCDSCRGAHYTYCDECSEYHADEDNTYIAGEGDFCEFCRDENFTVCDDCGEYVRNDDVTEVNDKFYCDTCREKYAKECPVCDEWKPLDTFTVREDKEEPVCCQQCARS